MKGVSRASAGLLSLYGMTVTYLERLGVPATMRGESCAYASSDDLSSDPNITYNSDVTTLETDLNASSPTYGSTLYFSTNWNSTFSCDWSPAENAYRLLVSGEWYYQAVKPLGSQWTGAGADATEKDKCARYNILDEVGSATTFRQYFGQLVGPWELGPPISASPIPLP